MIPFPIDFKGIGKEFQRFPDRVIKMANDEGIGGLYRVPGVRDIGRPYVFPKSPIAGKKERHEKESPKKPKGKTPPEASEEQEQGIDIKV